MPDIVAWHELSGGDVASHFDQYPAMEEELFAAGGAVLVTGGAPAAGGLPNGGSSQEGGGGTTDESGCSCRAAGSPARAPWGQIALAFGALAIARLRRLRGGFFNGLR